MEDLQEKSPSSAATSQKRCAGRLPSVSLPPFEQVFSEHAATVLRVCRAVVPEHEAEDCAADAFLAALDAYPRLGPGSDVRAWLVTIAHRKALDAWRRRARRAVPVAETPEVPRAGSSREGELSGDDELWAAVRSLPEKQRQAVAYRYVAGLRYREVASLTGTSEAAARRSAADGVRALRRLLATASERPEDGKETLR